MRRLVLLLTLLLAAACSGQPTQLPIVAATPDPQATATSGPTPADGVPAALAFTADTIDGATFEGGQYAGQDLMIWFWAPW